MEDQNEIKIWDASQDRQPKIQSSSVEETLQRIMGQTNNDCRFRIFIFDKFPTPATFACWKIRFKTEVCICPQFPTEAMLWIKEVKMVESVHDLKSSCSLRGIRPPDFEVLDVKIASALNGIIHNTRFKKKVSLEEQKAPKRVPLSYRKANRLPDPRVLPGHWSRPIHNCSSKWWSILNQAISCSRQ